MESRALDDLKKLILQSLEGEGVKVFLFGSRARGDADPGSDVDIGILPVGPFDETRLTLLRERIENSTLPYRVELVNLAEVSAEFFRQAMRDAVAWSG